MMTTAETLLTQGANEKRLRISAIVPKIIKHTKLTNFQISKLLDEFYKIRNDFVHGGKVRFDIESESYELLAQIISKLLVYYFAFSEDIVEDSQILKIKQWDNYVNNIFETIIYGNDNDNIKMNL